MKLSIGVLFSALATAVVALVPPQANSTVAKRVNFSNWIATCNKDDFDIQRHGDDWILCVLLERSLLHFAKLLKICQLC